MATRPVFMAILEPSYFKQVDVDFTWNGGFAVSQKQKNIRAIHEAFTMLYPDKRILEISSKSFFKMTGKI